MKGLKHGLPAKTRRSGLSVSLWRRIEAFRKEFKYTCWHIEDGDELTFYDGSEPFSYTEYKAGSSINVRWKILQMAVDKELRKARKRTP